MNGNVNDEQLLDFCQRLIRTRSYSGEESAVALLIHGEAKRLGFDDAWLDDYGNAVCKLTGRAVGNRKSILFDGHMDTVPANEDNWTHA
ncbi:MAG: YgeY family selenium metabolism-linked hydrolase, partial [Clostridiales Family XIII bacterium]|nr:YgeY family selenium metabolism-linked hydrolase [Clostridiales Family XIII bacterium]